MAQWPSERARGQLQELARHLGDPHALGPIVLTSFVMFFGLYACLDAAANSVMTPRSFIGAGALSIIAALALCMLARYFLLPVVAPAARVWVVLGVFAAAGITRNLTLGVLCHALGIPIEPTSLLTAAIGTVIVMSIAALTVGRCREHRNLMTGLSARQAELHAMHAGFDESVAASHDGLIRQAHGFLDPAVVELTDLLDASKPASAEALTIVLTSTVTEVVRPLTDRLSIRPAPDAAQLPLEPGRTVPYRLIQAQVNAPDTIQPGIIIVFTVLTLMIRSQVMPLALNNEAFLLEVLGTCLMLTLARRYWPNRLRVLSLPLAALALASVFAAAQIVPSGFLRLIFPHEASLATPSGWVSLTYWVILGWAVLAPGLVRQLAAQQEQAAVQVNTGLEVAEACLRRQLWINRRNLTWVLHGPIQSALISSAMALSRGDDSAAVRERVRTNLASAMAQLDAQRLARPDLPTALAEIAAVWSASCLVTLTIAEEAHAILADDPDAVTCITEIASEGVSNAVRHGGAGRVTVIVDAPDNNPTGLVRVRVVDDGAGMAASATPGHGTAMLDELTHSWTRRSAGLRTTLSASVATRVP